MLMNLNERHLDQLQKCCLHSNQDMNNMQGNKL